MKEDVEAESNSTAEAEAEGEFEEVISNQTFLKFFNERTSSKFSQILSSNPSGHGLRTPNEGINQRNLKIWGDVADKICFGST